MSTPPLSPGARDVQVTATMTYTQAKKKILGPLVFGSEECIEAADTYQAVEELRAFIATNLKRIKLANEFNPATDTCSACSGEGERECNLGHFHDCSACDGEGKIKGAPTWETDVSPALTAKSAKARLAKLKEAFWEEE